MNTTSIAQTESPVHRHPANLDKAYHLLVQRDTYKALQAIRKQVKSEFGSDLHVRTPDDAMQLLTHAKRSHDTNTVQASIAIETLLVNALEVNPPQAGTAPLPAEKPKRMYRGVVIA